MAVTMSTARIKDDARQELKSKNVEIPTGGAQLGADVVANNPGGKAGITDSLVDKFRIACTEYIADVDAIINEIEEIDSSSAFKGPSLQTALSNFIVSIKKAAKDFTYKFDTAENQIIESVGTAYQTQDSDIASDLNADSNNIVS